jgi:hypothetical protein
MGRAVAAVATIIMVLLFGSVSMAGAHSLESSTIAVQVTGDSAEATVSLAIETLDEALETEYLSQDDLGGYVDEIVAYVDEHLTVNGPDGTEWTETYTNAERTTVEGIESFSVDVAFDTGGQDPDWFTITYDAIIESMAGHEAVVVLTDPDGEISSPGVIDAANPSLIIGEDSADVATGDMIRYGFEHVLEGADHLLFLSTLLLPAPLMIVAGRWRRSSDPLGTVRKVIHVVTSFTVGHSITLIASALGWISLPSRPVEVVIALSVAVSATHAIRPLAAHGEEMIAAGFGLVHGLAFAGILADLGLSGTNSLVALLAFNIGIELAQLATTAAVFPSLYLLSTTRCYTALRVGGASLALAAALGWALDRLTLATNPFTAIEDAVITHPWTVVAALAATALGARTIDGYAGRHRVVDDDRPAPIG